MSTRSFLLSMCLALPATSSWACRAPPVDLLIGVDAQIATAVDVSVAQVVDAVPQAFGGVEYRFVVRERLAGQDRAEFTLLGGRATTDGKDTAASRHADPAFWAHGGGRVWNGPDCKMHPHFNVGDLYLVFQGAPATWRSFERIQTVNGGIDRGDQWLAYVEARLQHRPLVGDGTPDYERIGRFIYAFHRAVARQDLELRMGSPLLAPHTPPELVQRAHALAQAFDRILSEHGRASDDDMDAVLREAAAVGAAIKALPAAASQ